MNVQVTSEAEEHNRISESKLVCALLAHIVNCIEKWVHSSIKMSEVWKDDERA